MIPSDWRDQIFEEKKKNWWHKSAPNGPKSDPK